MKTDEISGTGNHNTALYWEYDTRLGRRWNIDPITKPWFSPYTCFSLNPIINVDPLGDDDYFNLRGEFLGTDGNTKSNLIRIIYSNEIINSSNFYLATKDGNRFVNAETALKNSVLLSQLTYSEYDLGLKGSEVIGENIGSPLNNALRLEKIAKFYSGRNIGVGNHEESIAFTTGSESFINIKDGKLNTYLNDFNNMQNVLKHEEFHVDDNADDVPRTYYNHFKIYVRQINHTEANFGKTSLDFQVDMAASSMNYLLNAYFNDQAEDYNKSFFDQDLQNLNISLSAYGLSISQLSDDKKSFKVTQIVKGKYKTSSYAYEKKQK